MSWEMIAGLTGIVAIIIATSSLYFTNKKNDRSLFNELTAMFFEVHNRWSDLKQTPKKQRDYDYKLFNTIEYVCYHANRNKIVRKGCVGYFRDAFADYINNTLKTHASKDFTNEKKYAEWKRFLKRTNKNTIFSLRVDITHIR